MPILLLVLEPSLHLINHLCPWDSLVKQIKLFSFKEYYSYFANTIYSRLETLPKQTGMFHNSPAKDFVSVFCFIAYGDEYIVHNSHVMTLIEYKLQT